MFGVVPADGFAGEGRHLLADWWNHSQWEGGVVWSPDTNAQFWTRTSWTHSHKHAGHPDQTSWQHSTRSPVTDHTHGWNTRSCYGHASVWGRKETWWAAADITNRAQMTTMKSSSRWCSDNFVSKNKCDVSQTRTLSMKWWFSFRSSVTGRTKQLDRETGREMNCQAFLQLRQIWLNPIPFKQLRGILVSTVRNPMSSLGLSCKRCSIHDWFNSEDKNMAVSMCS